MKVLSLSFWLLILLLPFFSNAQQSGDILRIQQIDERIYLTDHGRPIPGEVKPYSRKEVQQQRDSILTIFEQDTIAPWNHPKTENVSVIKLVENELIPALRIHINDYDKDKFKRYISYISHSETITWLEYVFGDIVDKAEDDVKKGKVPINHPTELSEMMAMIRKRIDEILEKEFTFYSFTETSKKYVKYIAAEHSNDFLSFHNDDRDYTGGFRFEVATDWLKLRFFGSWKDRALNPNSRNWYSYQSIFMGGEGYTPYLRDTTIFNTPTAVDSADRPYASFKYWGRAKYRISRHGHIRILSEFKVGSLGSEAPKVIQSAIHRDINSEAVTPKGWDAQIAAGGRTALSYHVMHEFMLFSRGWLISPGITRRNNYFAKGRPWLNISVFDDIRIGHDLTALGVGLNWSNKNFKESGAVGLPFLKQQNVNRRIDFFTSNFILNARVQYRYVKHNSMLEGYGIFKQVKDEDPDTPDDQYILTNKQINRHLLMAEFTLSMRLKYCGVFFKQTLMSPEYDLPVNTKIYDFAQDKKPGLHNRHPWNHVGTIGVVFKVQ